MIVYVHLPTSWFHQRGRSRGAPARMTSRCKNAGNSLVNSQIMFVKLPRSNVLIWPQIRSPIWNGGIGRPSGGENISRQKANRSLLPSDCARSPALWRWRSSVSSAQACVLVTRSSITQYVVRVHQRFRNSLTSAAARTAYRQISKSWGAAR